MIRQILLASMITVGSTVAYIYPATALKNYPSQEHKLKPLKNHSENFSDIKKPIILAQAQAGIDLGELAYDFTPVTQFTRVTKMDRDTFGQSTPISVIQFIAEAKQFITPLGYSAYFYDSNGVEVGFVPVEMEPSGSIQPGQRVYVTIPLILTNPNAQVSQIVIRRL